MPLAVMAGETSEKVLNVKSGNYMRIFQKQGSSTGKINILLSDLLGKKEEIASYKKRLKELESAFYYNLEIISERDLEISVLEKQLINEKAVVQKVNEEKSELEDVVKTIDNKNYRKIQQLSSKLALKDEEINELQREIVKNASSLKKLLNDTKQLQEEKIQRLTNKFEAEKNDLKVRCGEKIEEREKYFQQKLDDLSARLEEVLLENEKIKDIEEENKCLKCDILEMERLFLEKENFYLYELSKFSANSKKKHSKEVQCSLKVETKEKISQTATADSNTIFTQTIFQQQYCDGEENSTKRIKFLQDQNEVLKCVVKDLKKNLINESKNKTTTDPFLEEKLSDYYSAIRVKIEQINEKFDLEIKCLKQMLQEEQKQRAEEESIIQNLEMSVTCLKDKLLKGIQENLQQISGEKNVCSCTYNTELHNEIKVSVLEEKLLKKIESSSSLAEQERRKLDEKLEHFKIEWISKVENMLKEKQEPEIKSEGLVEKIRQEIHKLESKIASDMKNTGCNNFEISKRDKNMKTKVRFADKNQILQPIRPKPRFQDSAKLKYFPKANINKNNHFSTEEGKKIEIFPKECRQKKITFPNEFIMAR